MFVDVQGVSRCFAAKIFNVCASHPLVTYFVESLGASDFEIGIETPDARLVSSVIEELDAQTGGHIGSTQVFMKLEDLLSGKRWQRCATRIGCFILPEARD